MSTENHQEKYGYDRLSDPALNKSTSFTAEEREKYKLRGLLPYTISNQKIQMDRVLGNLRRSEYDIERYIFMQALQIRNERLYYQLILEHIDELMPIIYTPTVGQACQEFANIFRQAQGFYITPEDKGKIRGMLDNWPKKDVAMIVITDGERILGLGDLGANGMGIPIGKLALYTACAGIPPDKCLPVMLDVGTNNTTLREDPLYLGYTQSRLRGEAYDALIEEFVDAVQDAFPRALIQFEDFLTPNAYKLLNRWRDKVLCFNDDIQGTAAVALAGVLTSTRVTDTPLQDLRIMFLGAGSAAAGIADLMCVALQNAGLSKNEALEHLWFVDRKGLVVQQRDNLAPHIKPYAHDVEALTFHEAIQTIKPHVLIGATGAPGVFTETVVRLMAKNNARPVIFALSNPTSRSECSAEQAYEWTDGKALFASGSPFDAVNYQGQVLHPGQGNNAYIFPGIGLGAIACQARSISDEMFLAAAQALADRVSESDLASGTLYPPLSNIRSVSLAIAVSVANKAWEQGLAQSERPADVEQSIRNYMYCPEY